MASVGSSITRQENPIVQDDKNDSEVKYLCSVGRQRNLKLEEEVYFYLLDRFGVMLANWLQDAFVGLFKCTDPEDHRDQDIAVWACPIDASQLKDRTQEPELEKLTVDYTQGYMGDAFADFLSLIFCGHIQEGLVDSRSGMNMMMILTKPLCLLIEKIEKKRKHPRSVRCGSVHQGPLESPRSDLAEGSTEQTRAVMAENLLPSAMCRLRSLADNKHMFGLQTLVV